MAPRGKKRKHRSCPLYISFALTLCVSSVSLLASSLHFFSSTKDDNNEGRKGAMMSNLAPLNAITNILSEKKLSQERRILYRDDQHIGVTSTKDPTFFYELQATIDTDNNTERCERYGGYYNSKDPKNRRIFYGGLIASEPWEVFEIIAAETRGIFAGLVFVESNRTQNFTPRPFLRLNHTDKFRMLFATDQVEVVKHVNEKQYFHHGEDNHIAREHEQRADIITGWKRMGMQKDDIGLLTDLDETFSRDFLRAWQVCDGIDAFDYESHHCEHSKVKITSYGLVFESSPECVTAGRVWNHPDAIIGHCIEGIGDPEKHPPARRVDRSFLRPKGLGGECDWSLELNVTDSSFNSLDASDFRRLCAGYQLPLNRAHKKYSRYTGFHFHNFFADAAAIRFKMTTYGHPVEDADTKPVHRISNDLKMMYNCAKGLPDSKYQKRRRRLGGFSGVKSFTPIYFKDADYRTRRHAHLQQLLATEEKEIHQKQYREDRARYAHLVSNMKRNVEHAGRGRP